MTIARLTTKARTKFADMRDAVEEAHTKVLSTQRRISETEKQIRNLNHETEPAAVLAYEQEIERLRPRLSDEQSNHIALSRLVTSVSTWLMQLSPNVELRDTPNKFYILEDKDLISAADRCHADIVKLSQQRLSVARALLPLEVLHSQIDAHVEALAARARPSITVDRDQLSVRHSSDSHGVGSSAAVPLLAWLMPDAMRQRLREEIDARRASDSERNLPVLSVSERKAQLAELDARILELGREEEFFILEAAAEGTTIRRRDNADPVAILGVEIVKVDAATRAKRKSDDERNAAAKRPPASANPSVVTV
jgi:hypothetical protein